MDVMIWTMMSEIPLLLYFGLINSVFGLKIDLDKLCTKW